MGIGEGHCQAGDGLDEIPVYYWYYPWRKWMERHGFRGLPGWIGRWRRARPRDVERGLNVAGETES